MHHAQAARLLETNRVRFRPDWGASKNSPALIIGIL